MNRSDGFSMGIVKISEALHDDVRAVHAALSRSINAQAEHWMRIGMLAELHPTLGYVDLCRLLVDGARPVAAKPKRAMPRKAAAPARRRSR